jgi:hypothetical protein
MTAGFQAINQNNFVQIDQDYKNYLLYETRTINCTTPTRNAYYTDVDLAYGVDAFIAYVDSDYACHSVVSVSGNTVRYRFFKLGSAGAITIVVFRVSPPAISQFGLQVFDASGALVFDALMPYMRILDFIQGPNISGLNNNYGRRVAVAQGRRIWVAREAPLGQGTTDQWTYVYDSMFASASGGIVRTTYGNIDVIGPYTGMQYNGVDGGSDYGAYLVLDFSGL